MYDTCAIILFVQGEASSEGARMGWLEYAGENRDLHFPRNNEEGIIYTNPGSNSTAIHP